MKMCSAFVEAGIDTVMVAPKYFSTYKNLKKVGSNLWEFYSVPNNFNIEWMPFYYPFPRLRKIAHSLVTKIYANLNNIDFVYTRSEWVAALLAKQGIPTILELHQHIKSLGISLAAKVAKENSNLLAVVCISKALAEAVVDWGFPEDKVFVASDGVDLERFTPNIDIIEAKKLLGISPDTQVLGYVGHLYKGRGIDTIIEVAKLRPETYFLIVGGREKEITYWKNLLISNELNNVNIVGNKPNQELPNYLYASDILLMPYTKKTPTYETMSPMKMFEYMAARRPIIASDFPVIREVLSDRENAILVRPANVEDIINAIDLLSDDKKLRERIASNAYNDVLNYTWHERVKKIFSFLDERNNKM